VVVGVRCTVPAGRRLRTAVTILVAVVGISFLLGSTTEASRRAGLDALGPAVGVLLVVAGGAAIGTAAGIVRTRWALALVGAAVVVLFAVDLARDLRGDDVADRRREASYEQSGAPLALIGGTDLEAGYEWELQAVSRTDDDTVLVQYRRGDRDMSLWLEAAPAELDCVDPTCEELGRRADGKPIFGRPDPRIPDVYTDVWTDVDGGRWRIDSARSFGADAAVGVLESLEPVDAATFVAGS
jgi:hypothetical protein